MYLSKVDVWTLFYKQKQIKAQGVAKPKET